MTTTKRFSHQAVFLFVLLFAPICLADSVDEGLPRWIWTPLQAPQNATAGACFFRRTFELEHAVSASLRITADDTFEVYINGTQLGRGANWKNLAEFNVTQLLAPGENSIAVKVVNQRGKTAGLVAKLSFDDGTEIITDEEWKCSLIALGKWKHTRFADSKWKPARELGVWGRTAPWIVPSAARNPGNASSSKTPRQIPHRAELEEESQPIVGVPVEVPIAPEPPSLQSEDSVEPKAIREIPADHDGPAANDETSLSVSRSVAKEPEPTVSLPALEPTSVHEQEQEVAETRSADVLSPKEARPPATKPRNPVIQAAPRDHWPRKDHLRQADTKNNAVPLPAIESDVIAPQAQIIVNPFIKPREVELERTPKPAESKKPNAGAARRNEPVNESRLDPKSAIPETPKPAEPVELKEPERQEKLLVPNPRTLPTVDVPVPIEGEAPAPIPELRVNDTVEVPAPHEELVAQAPDKHAGSPQRGRFTTRPGFTVTQVISGDTTGSLLSATFNEFGQLLAGRENGPLVLLRDSNRDNELDEIRVVCDRIRNCHGLLALSGSVFAVADGPQGTALYRLDDQNRDGNYEVVTALVEFDVSAGEHGPHGITLGPDGRIYVVAGNHTKLKGDFANRSPRRHMYEGDLVPRYEDPGGHASGVRIPAGFVMRTDVNGKVVELFASGLRNAYDIAFNATGQLFTMDSDMESDSGTNWYRPTRMYHVTPGSEFGWRSGWAKWPSYYHDALPPVIDMGRGSPTGIVFYEHETYPPEYHHAAFVGDWSNGRILAIKPMEKGASFEAASETFLEGTPLNVTDLEVGPNGLLYFVTGGRGTSGGLYRVDFQNAQSRPGVKRSGIVKALSAPQINSSWGRQSVAAVHQELQDDWKTEIVGAAQDTSLTVAERLQSLQLMQWLGPIPSSELLLSLSEDADASIRRMASYLMAGRDDDRLPMRQLELLDDAHPAVRRQACESLVRSHRSVPFEYVVPALRSEDRFEAWAGRRLLSLDDPSEWQDQALATSDVRVFIHASTALMTAWPTKERGIAVAERAVELMKTYISDDEFVDFLRMLQIATLRGELTTKDIPTLAAALADEFPANGHVVMNRELSRLLVRLQVTSIKDRYLRYLTSGIPAAEKIHMVTHLRFLQADWSQAEKLTLLENLVAPPDAKSSVASYLQNVANDVAKELGPDDDHIVLENAEHYPIAAVAALTRLPKQLSPAQIEKLVEMDNSIEGRDENLKRLKVAILAVLARSGQDAAMAHLRYVYDNDPSRRVEVTIGLSEQPEGANWPYLVRSLELVQGDIAKELIGILRSINRSPEGAAAYRHVIEMGLQLGDNGGMEAVRLLEHWQGYAHTPDTPPWRDALAIWKKWFAQTYPEEAEITVAKSIETTKWDYDELVKRLNQKPSDIQKSIARGKNVFAEAKCASCHQHGDFGESMGPNLSTVGKRFLKHEILESIVDPSKVISDQYKAKTLITDEGKSYTGIVGSGGQGELTVLQADGTKVRIPADTIEQTVPSKVSAMPAGLIDSLSAQQVADLINFLENTPAIQVSEAEKDTLQR